MSLIIKDPETHRLARQLADITDLSMTRAVTLALQEALERRNRTSKFEKLEEISRRCADMPVKDKRPADTILGYDENGLPS